MLLLVFIIVKLQPYMVGNLKNMHTHKIKSDKIFWKFFTWKQKC